MLGEPDVIPIPESSIMSYPVLSMKIRKERISNVYIYIPFVYFVVYLSSYGRNVRAR